jgi:hypothetical protein
MLDIELSQIEIASAMTVLSKEAVQTLLSSLLPEDFFLRESQKEFVNEQFPILRSKEEMASLTITLLCLQRDNVGHFFYDMVSRWLIPNKRLNVDLFFSVDFRIGKLISQSWTIAQAVLTIHDEAEREEIRKNLKNIETEIRLGVISDYHANRVMEFKALTSDRKTMMIQEKIGSLMKSRPQDFGRSIFTQMQHFLVTCREDFKTIRDPHHISRLISVIYYTRKGIKERIDREPNQRHVNVKFFKTRLHLPERDRVVLGVLVGLNFFSEREIFGKDHLMQVIESHMPNIQMIENSFFIDRNNKSSIQTIYLEIEKKEGGEFSSDDVHSLRQHLPGSLRGAIEQLVHPVFMPRNEEEIVRSIMALSRQIRYVQDIPQLIINFDQQTGAELSFTIVLLRVLKADSEPILKILSRSRDELHLSLDRVKKVGLLRRRHYKEANVLRAVFASRAFLRADHSVDLNQARHFVLSELTRLFGEVRDYNGGMIGKQNQAFRQLKADLGIIGEKHEILLEKFFYAVQPVEMTLTRPSEPLKNLFLMLVNAVNREESRIRKRNDWLFKQEAKAVYVIVPLYDPVKKKKLIETMEELHFLSSEVISFEISLPDASFVGYVYFCPDILRQKNFLKQIQQALDF